MKYENTGCSHNIKEITADNSDLLSLSSTCKEVQTFVDVMNQLSVVQTKLPSVMVLKFKFDNFSSKRDAFNEILVQSYVNLLFKRKFEQIELF